MKRLYIGLGVSVALIIGGISYSTYAKPKVNMANMGKYFYQLEDYREHNKYDIKVISSDFKSFKARIDIKDFSGPEDLKNLIHSMTYEQNLDKKDMEGLYEYFSIPADELAKKLNLEWKEGDPSPQPKKETITYKWVEKPDNLILTTREYDHHKDTKIEDGVYASRKPVLDKGEIPLSGTITANTSLENKSVRIQGVRGSGVLEVEFNKIYK